MDLSEITPLILTFNEQENIGRTIRRLEWAARIVVVDSFSTDETLSILGRCPNVEVLQRRFDEHARQWNFGLENVRTPWTLALDADYICLPGFIDELATLQPEHAAYDCRFRYAIFGSLLTGTLYPPRTCLFRTGAYRYVQDGHTQRLETGTDSLGIIATMIVHDDRKPLSRWLRSQQRYAELEAAKIRSLPRGHGSRKSRLRRLIWIAPFLNLAYCLFYKRLLLNGWPGIYYSFQRMYAELLLSLELLDRRLSEVKVSDAAEDSSASAKEESIAL